MNFDFDILAELAQHDPAEFEARRKEIIEETLKSYSPSTQAKLKDLQCQIDSSQGELGETISLLRNSTKS